MVGDIINIKGRGKAEKLLNAVQLQILIQVNTWMNKLILYTNY